MTTVATYQFEKYDIHSGQYIKSTRWATEEAIQRIEGARKIAETKIHVDETQLNSDIEGMTEIDFNPHQRQTGPQKIVGFGY